MTQAIDSFFTDEQNAIIHSREPRLRGLAFAGTGKTSTLVGYARARKDRMLYVAYNKAIQLDAQKKFPTNVTCRTTHALAYPSFGVKYKHKLGNMRVGDVADCLRLSFVHAAHVVATLNAYLYSADDELGAEHLPVDVRSRNALETTLILDGAERLWARMQDPNDSSVSTCHDAYLKLYALSRPILQCDVVLFDEAQDANPVTSSILLQHKGRVLVVGDPFQAIYGYRGARDALNDLQGAKTFALTQSFRFGKGIAQVANQLLAYLGEQRQIIGAGRFQNSRMDVDRSRPFAYIARTNMSLIQAAIETLPHKLRSHYVGGVENVKLSLIEDGWLLSRGQTDAIKDRFIRKFSSIWSLIEYANEAKDQEMSLLCKIVRTYTDQIPSILQQIRALAVESIDDAQRVFSTAHRSKGLEFGQVILADDFAPLVENGQLLPLSEIDRQEIHLHYVAATRAIEALQPSAQLQAFLRVAERNHLRQSVPGMARGLNFPPDDGGF